MLNRIHSLRPAAALLLALALAAASPPATPALAQPRRIVFLAGPKDHGAFIPECAWFVGLTSDDPYDAIAPQNSYLARGNHTVTCGIGLSLGGTHTPRE